MQFLTSNQLLSTYGFCVRDWFKGNEKEPDDVKIVSVTAERNSLQV